MIYSAPPAHETALQVLICKLGPLNHIYVTELTFPSYLLRLRNHAVSCEGATSAFSALSSAVRISPIAPFMTLGIFDHDSFILWSVIRSCGKLYVRTFSERSPVPTWALRSAERSLASRSSCAC